MSCLIWCGLKFQARDVGDLGCNPHVEILLRVKTLHDTLALIFVGCWITSPCQQQFHLEPENVSEEERP